jgi:hypothetical protein
MVCSGHDPETRFSLFFWTRRIQMDIFQSNTGVGVFKEIVAIDGLSPEDRGGCFLDEKCAQNEQAC